MRNPFSGPLRYKSSETHSCLLKDLKPSLQNASIKHPKSQASFLAMIVVTLMRCCVRPTEWISSQPLGHKNRGGEQSALLLGNFAENRDSIEMSDVYYQKTIPFGFSHFCLSCNKAEVSTGFIPQHLWSKMSRVSSEWSVLEDRGSVSVESKGRVYLLAVIEELYSQSSDSFW